MSWQIHLKLLKIKSYSLRNSASFHPVKSYIYIYKYICICICLIYIYLLSNGVDILLILRFSRSYYDIVVILCNGCWYSLLHKPLDKVTISDLYKKILACNAIYLLILFIVWVCGEVNKDIILDEYFHIIAFFGNNILPNASLSVDVLSVFLNNMTSTWKHNYIHPLRMQFICFIMKGEGTKNTP